MRERHNIVGSEVGRPRPPVYLRLAPRVRPRRLVPVWLWALAALTAAVLIVLLAKQAGGAFSFPPPADAVGGVPGVRTGEGRAI